jgi:hypothetical protein
VTGRRVVALVLALLALGLPARAQAPQPSGAPWRSEVQALLDRRAAAVRSGDERAFLDTMAGAPEAFRRERLESFRRLRSLPLGDYRLELAPDELDEVTRAADRERRGGEVHVLQVKERISFRGYDALPEAEDLFLTVVREAGGWSVVGDADAEDLGLQSARHLWDFGPVGHLEADGVLIVFHPAEREAAARVLAATRAARDAVRSSWPLDWRRDRIVVMIPETAAELARILQTTFDLSTFVAFAASSVDRSAGWGLVGTRVFLHWPNFRRSGASFQRTILRHELTHVAAAEVAGPFVRAVLDEGIAQYYGEGEEDPVTPELRRRVRAGRFGGRLPPDYRFTLGPPADIVLSYEEAARFAAYLGDRFGRDAPARLYRAVSAGTAVAPGTWRYHLDRACRETFGVPFQVLERDWARSVTRELS